MLIRNPKRRNRKNSKSNKAAAASNSKNIPTLVATYPMQPATYALSHDLPLSDVWKMIRTGELLVHNDGNQLLIYETIESLPKTSADSKRSLEGAHVTEKPTFLPEVPTEQSIATSAELAISSEQHSTQVALLIDHLSLAKEENKEIIRLAQDSMSQSVKMTESILHAKDMILEAKSSEIERLETKLKEQDRLVNKLKQENEDLEILTKLST